MTQRRIRRLRTIGTHLSFLLTTLLYITSGAAANDRDKCAQVQGDSSIAACSNLLSQLSSDPDRANIYALRGIGYRNKKEFESAIADFSQVLQLVKSFAAPDLIASAHVARASAYSQMGDEAKALVDYQAALELAPNNSLAADGVRRAERALASVPSRSGSVSSDTTHTPFSDSDGSSWKVGGSVVSLGSSGSDRSFFLDKPSGELLAKGVIPGALLFRGKRDGNNFMGTAYAFTPRCGPSPYEVFGEISNEQRVVRLQGPAPTFSSACVKSGTHFELLVFEFLEAKPSIQPTVSPASIKTDAYVNDLPPPAPNVASVVIEGRAAEGYFSKLSSDALVGGAVLGIILLGALLFFYFLGGLVGANIPSTSPSASGGARISERFRGISLAALRLAAFYQPPANSNTLRTIFGFAGRISSTTYLLITAASTVLLLTVSLILLTLVSGLPPTRTDVTVVRFVLTLAVLAWVVSLLAATVRRLHDFDWKGWWSFLLFTPLLFINRIPDFGVVVILVMLIVLLGTIPGAMRTNRFGYRAPRRGISS